MISSNLHTLADWMEANPNRYRFSLHRWALDANLRLIEKASDWQRIQTACVIAHGPAAGLEPRDHEKWPDYQRRVFDLHDKQWLYCFAVRYNKTHSYEIAIKHLRFVADGYDVNYAKDLP